jgi:hypothetical protein
VLNRLLGVPPTLVPSGTRLYVTRIGYAHEPPLSAERSWRSSKLSTQGRHLILREWLAD